MICLEVTINGDRRVIAGAASAETIEAAVVLYPGFGESNLKVAGAVEVEGQPSADATWLRSKLTVGDTVVVRVVDITEPGAPTLSRTDPSIPATDHIPFVCAFCSKPSVEVEGMIASPKAFICHECVRELYKMVAQP